MTHVYQVDIAEFKSIKIIPNDWSLDDYKNILNALEYGDVSEISESELEETCLLYLSDNEPEDAAKIILNYVFEDELTSGQIDNASNEMLEEQLWEEYADLSKHEKFFNAGQILYKAYNGKFPMPEAVQFTAKIICKNQQEKAHILEHKEDALIQLLVQGMPVNTILKRLYKTQLENKHLEDAEHIIWQMVLKEEGLEVSAKIISSEYWFHDLKHIEPFEAKLTIAN